MKIYWCSREWRNGGASGLVNSGQQSQGPFHGMTMHLHVNPDGQMSEGRFRSTIQALRLTPQEVGIGSEYGSLNSRRSGGPGMKSRLYGHARGLKSLGLIAGLLIVAAAAGCASTNSSRHVPRGHSISTSQSRSMGTRLAAVNAMYSAIHSDPPWKATLIANPPTVPLSAGEAANRAVVACHEGAGTKTVAAALVNTSQGTNPEWAVFLNPPGKHMSISFGMVPPKHPAILNWYAAFVPVRGSQPIFCTFGKSTRLPALPVFGTQK